MSADRHAAYRAQVSDILRDADVVLDRTRDHIEQGRAALTEHERADYLARLIKRASKGRGWCSTPPLAIAKYLLAQGVTLPTETEVKQ